MTDTPLFTCDRVQEKREALIQRQAHKKLPASEQRAPIDQRHLVEPLNEIHGRII